METLQYANTYVYAVATTRPNQMSRNIAIGNTTEHKSGAIGRAIQALTTCLISDANDKGLAIEWHTLAITGHRDHTTFPAPDGHLEITATVDTTPVTPSDQ